METFLYIYVRIRIRMKQFAYISGKILSQNLYSTTSMADHGKLHIVMFPWLAFGHMIPYLELSKLIAKKGHKVSFVSTQRNIDRLPKLPPNLASQIDFVKFPLPTVDQLPENAEATIEVPPNKVKYLKLAYDGLLQPLARFLEESSPDWIFYDFAPYWLPPIASKLNISTAFFSIYTASLLCFGGPVEVLKGTKKGRTKPEEFTVPPQWVPFETALAFKLFEILRIFDAVTGDEENVSDTFRLGSAIEGCDILVIRSCYEFEPEWLKLIKELHHKPVIPVGQLPTTGDNNSSDDEDDSWRAMKVWLDNHSKGSVVYVAFGSETKPNQTELTEMALGLELSELPFFWVLRSQRGSADTEIVELPEGFEERTKGRGLVCRGWAPQLKILSHESVGGFLCHSGLSSVIEAIEFEKALVLLPFLADLGLISRFLEEKKIGHVIPRDDRDGSFSRDSVAESLRFVMIGEEGKIYRDKIKETKGLICDPARQDRDVDDLLGYLQAATSGKKEKNKIM